MIFWIITFNISNVLFLNFCLYVHHLKIDCLVGPVAGMYGCEGRGFESWVGPCVVYECSSQVYQEIISKDLDLGNWNLNGRVELSSHRSLRIKWIYLLHMASWFETGQNPLEGCYYQYHYLKTKHYWLFNLNL